VIRDDRRREETGELETAVAVPVFASMSALGSSRSKHWIVVGFTEFLARF
jgi:hypothetical protein